MPRTPYTSYPGDQDRTNDDKVKHTQTSTTATAGTVATLPATARGYIIISVNGVDKKVPYYDV